MLPLDTEPGSIPLPTAPPRIGPAGRRALLDLARAGVDAAIAGREPAPPDPATLPEDVRGPGSAFVTLRENGDLRGCMGRLDPGRPAWRNVLDAAQSAAGGDPRFWPVQPDERAALAIEVSVLGPFVPLGDPAAFVPGLHGIVVERGGRRALLLPQVAPENDWDGPAMMGAVCRKAGLGEDAWRDPRTRLFVFTAAVFDEKSAGRESGAADAAP